MNPINPVNIEADCAEVYFTDGVCLGPMIAMRSVGDELAELITGTIDQLEFQELLPASLGTAGAVFVFRAVYACNHVSLNAPPNLNGLGAQIGYLHRREYAPGGIGVVIIDMRIGRTDLPVVISQNVYDRMRTERDREARELRAQGSEEAKKIRARADREKTVLLADAKRTSDILRGEGEGERNRILAAAFGKDPDFFDFYKSMEQYQKSLVGGTTMVLSPDSDFFRYFGQEHAK
ncbi:hypothetical protein LCGC14_2255600 [marine sediment metagenome]|uniref:Band 7 domain-containing protein n=1 Tax=marine sediment metagenome TaxID=412755 RepID=A0A0F9DNQ5_9ZZZZ